MSRFSLALELLLSAWAFAGTAFAAPAVWEPASAAGLPLQLEVFRNGQPTGLIAGFRRLANGRFTVQPSELRAIGLATPASSGELMLDELEGVTYRYDDAHQQMFIQAQPSAIAPLSISLKAKHETAPVSHDFGALLNYSLAADVGTLGKGLGIHAEGATGALEARVFGPFGLGSTGFAVDAKPGEARAVRLDTVWTWADPQRALAWRAGDLISGGFSWTRPLRLGGIQIRRDFATRPDLITMPTPVLSASAATPSTLDVMLGSSVVLSRQISAGPVRVSDLPVLQGQGDARLILRDAFGGEQQIVASYFAMPELLRPGLLDFSAEAGFARRNFGLLSNDYDAGMLGSGSVRYGLTSALTLQGHAEGGLGLANLGSGLVARVGSVGAVSLAASGSRLAGKNGALLAAGFQSRLSGITFSAQAQRTLGDYQDVAAVTVHEQWKWQGRDLGRTPTQLVQLALSAPIRLAALARWGNVPALTLTYAQAREAAAPTREMFSASLRYTLARRYNLQAALYAARSDRNDRGFSFAVSIPLGRGADASAGVDRANGRTAGFAEARRQEELQPRGSAWRLRVDQGQQTGVEAEAIYRSDVGRISGRATYVGGETQLDGRIDGALVWLGRPMLAGERLDGSFAVVDVGAPGVEVRYQNRPVGVSGREGQLLVSKLDPYEGNRLDIDVEGMPIELATERTHQVVSPPYGAGVLVRFGVSRAPLQTMLTLKLASGAAAPAGALASLNGGPENIVVGYDGQVFVASPLAANVLRLDLGDGAACTAQFTIDSAPEAHAHAVETVCR